MKWINVNKYFARYGETNEWTLTKNVVDAEGTVIYQLFHNGVSKGANKQARVLIDLHAELIK